MKNLTQFTRINRILIAFALLFSVATTAQVKQAFAPRYNQTVKGNVTIIANNMLSRTATGNYTGTADNHDFTDNVYVDIDSDNTTFNSSSANFANPHPTLECMTIKKVLLYWAAADKEPTSNMNSENQPNWNYNDVKIMLPGQSTYSTLTATGNEIIYRGRNETNHFGNDPYICVKDITTSVASLSNPYGKYQVANVEAKAGSLTSHDNTNTGTSGGWQIVFVYESPSLPRKNITLFDGYAHVTSGTNNFNINFNGFQTIPIGNVNADIVMGALEGDRSLSGDRLQIRNTAGNFVDISAPQRSSSNFFNSRITIGASDFLDRNPASTNTLGFDASVFKLSNPGNSIITNNQTSAVLRLTSNQETYGLYLLGLAVDVYAPDLDPIQLTMTGGNTVSPGAGIGFNFNVQNNGNDNAVNLAVSTTLPPQVDFVSASNLPSGVTYTHNPTTGNLTFNFANGLADIGDPNINIDFQLMIKDQCYFLEENCDLSFDLQFVATYNGIQNPALQNTLSSSGVGECNVGNLLPLTVNVIQPAAAVWATPVNGLDTLLQCDDTTGLATAQGLAPETDKCDFNLVKTSGPFVADATCGNSGSYTNTWVFTDACGRTISEFTQVISLVNNAAPTITVPANVTVECGDDTTPASTGTATGSDSCGTVTITFIDETTPGCGNTSTIRREWIATDECGTTLSDFQIITVVDSVAPALTVPAAANVGCGDDTSSAATGIATGTDSCGAVVITQSDAVDASCGNTSVITRTWTATDACGNTTSADQIITIIDTTAPSLVVPENRTVECGNDTSSASTGVATGIDNCGDVAITQSDTVEASCGNTSIITRTWTATDACGNTVSSDQIITVVDTTPPTLTVPADFTAECSNVSILADSGSATGSDTCGTTTISYVDNVVQGCGRSNVNTRTWTATDECGNFVSANQIITITDTTAPVLDGPLPEDISVECNGVPTAVTLTASDNCGSATVTFNETTTAGSCPSNYTIVRTWTATDECGLTASHTQTITVADTIPPTFVETLPAANVTVECDKVTTPITLTATDNCGDATVTFEETRTDGSCAFNYILVRTWTATDVCGLTTIFTQTVTVQDTTAPILNTPATNVIAECDGSGNTSAVQNWLDNNGNATATDSCGTVTWTNNYTGTASDCSAPVSVTFIATDECGNFVTTTATYAIQDSNAPVITGGSNSTVQCDRNGNINDLNTWLETQAGATATDDCSAISWTNNYTALSDDCGATGSATVTFTATDGCGNSASVNATFTIEDTTAPVIETAAANLTVECDGNGNLNDLNIWLASQGGATASDSCSNVTWTNNYSALSDDCGATGTATVIFTATDDCGNTSTSSAIFSIEDTTAPTIETAATNLTVECDGNGNMVELSNWLASRGGATASDSCSNVIWTNDYSALSDDCGATGTATVIFTATDDCGNTATSSATFTIEDTTAPAIETAAINLTVECDGNGNTNDLNDWLASQGGATASDTCSNVTWTNDYSALSDDCGATGTATVIFTATDDCGNTATSSATFTIEDTTNPVLDTPATDVVAECDGSGNSGAIQTWLDNNGNASASDACSNITWTNNYTGTASDCSAPISVTFTATDDCGNSVSTTATYAIQDSNAPVITGGSNLNVQCDGNGNINDLNTWLETQAGATATDDCSAISWTNNYTALSDDCGATGSATVTFTATDGCGNSASVNATFTIEDTTAPAIETAAANLTVECDGNGNTTDLNNWLASQGGATASDSCSNITWTNNYTTLSDECGATGSATVIFTATDDCGNTSTSSAIFSIEDTTAPAITTAATNLTVECDGNGNTNEFNNWLASQGGATAFDSCSDVTWTNNYSALSDDCGATGSATVIFTATDDCGNIATSSATFTIEDTTAPVIETAATNLAVECDGNGNTNDLNSWLASQGGATASDSCSNVTWTNDYSALSDDCGATGTASVIFTATDDCGNTATSSATFTIEDTTAPVIETTATNLTVECDGNGNLNDLNNWLAAQGGATASDSCSNVTWTSNYTALSDDCGATGTATVTFTATDDCGNTATSSATFTIEDTTNPVLDIPATDIVVECDGSGNNGAIENWLNANGNASASDSCSNITWTNNYAGEASDCSAPVSVTFTATDDCGNSVSTTATYTIQDSVPPVITGGSDLTVQCDGNGNIDDLNNWLATQAGAIASDDCSAIGWSNNFTALSDDCGATGSATVTFTVTDGCGNSASTTATFTIEDTTAPIIDTVAANLTVECDGNGNTEDLNNWLASQGGATASDSCSNVTWTNHSSDLSDGCGNSFVLSVTFKATDECGNIATTSATFTVEDTTAPVIETSASDLTVECDGNGNIENFNNWLASQGGATASDLCANVTWTNDFTELSNDCGATGSATVLFTATDECGNTATSTATFTIEDTTSPVIETAATNLTVECDGNGNTDELNSWLASQGGATASDTCSNVTWTNHPSDLLDGCGNTLVLSVTFKATDDCGNIATTSATFTIEDTTAPVIETASTNLTVECDGNGNIDDLNNWLASQGGASASDACSNVIWTNDYSALSDDCGATGTATVIFTATDDCGNTSTSSATFTIEDTTAPALTIEATDITIECDGSGNDGAIQDWLDNNGNASASDSCSPNITWTNNYNGTTSDCSAPVEVTFTATDDCGNSVSTTASYTIQDSVPPVITGGSDLTVECDGNGNLNDLNTWLASQAGATATDDCSSVVWSNNYTMLSDDCGATGSATVTFTVTDGCGNSESTTATFTIEDTTAPVIETAATNLTVECDGSGNMEDLNNWLALQGGASASDSCSNVTWTNNYTALSDECGATGSATVIFTATDDCGNTATSTATFTIQDTTAPVIIPNSVDLTVECDGNGNLEDLNNWLESLGGASASDSCSDITWTNDFIALVDDCGSTGFIKVIFTATDECGNSAITWGNFTIRDTTAPVIDTEATNLTVECDGNGNEADLNNWLASQGGASASDSCSNVTWTNDYSTLSDDCGATGTATVIFTATDDCGNTATSTATFTIEDTTAPVIETAATNLTVECDGSGNMEDLNNWLASQGGAIASDSCSNVTWTNDFTTLSDDCGATGTATVIFTATDECGNIATSSATFTIEDTTAPVILTPSSNLTVECDGNGNLDDLNNWLDTLGGATAEDACSNITWTNDFIALADDCGATGSIKVIFTATDECGNSEIAYATFTIQDTTAPVIDTVATDLTVECDGNGNIDEFNNWLTSQGGASASDSCSNVSWTNDFTTLSDDCGATGTATVTFTATDECGNVATSIATFTIEDTIAPVIETPATNLTVECDGNGNMDDLNNWLASQGGASASDSCSNVTWTNDYSALSDDCGATGTATVIFTATDDCGNTAISTATFTIEDTTAPVIGTPSNDLTVECDGNGNMEDLNNWLASQGGAIASDSCSNVTWTNDYSILSDDCGATGSATVVFTATDDCGNTTTSSATFTIADTTPPVIDTDATDLAVECDGAGNLEQLNNWLTTQGGASSSDACSNVTWTNDFTALTALCGNTGTATVTFTATDDCGNVAMTVAMFTIEDTIAPVIVGEFEPVINVNCDDVPEIPNLDFQDACSTNMTVTGPTETIIGNVDSNYQIVREWTVDDGCNSYTYTQTINVTVQSATIQLSNDLCQDIGPLNLFDELPADVDTSGTWVVTSGNATLNGNIFDQSNSDFGNYIFTYTEAVAGECPTKYELTITVIDCVVLPCGEEDVIISTTVTPNGDAYNEYFEVKGIEECGFTIELQIFNRWGAKIYENFNYQNDWNGFASKGSIGSSDKVPTGTYYYIINLKDSGLKPFAGPIYIATK